jgi:uncharacterized protein YdhG (YjbR/CyaY superfamily)
MPATKPSTVDEYIAGQPPALQKVLPQVRDCIRKALPDAEEVISYGIPAYRVQKRIAVYFAGWKEHYSIYPITQALTAALKADLEKYELSGRGTVRFPLSSKVPTGLIARIAKFRAREIAEQRTAAKRRPARH